MLRREAEHLEGMLREKQDEIERHQTDLKFSVAELEQRDKEISDRETRLEVLINTLKDKDSLLRKFREEKERLAHELQASKVNCIPA